MARFTSPVQQPFAPLSRVAPLYLDQALMDIEKNMQAQRIYPTEVYRGYEKVNQYRKDHGMWYSTGEGAKSFEGHIYQADDQKGLLTVGIRYNDYLRYVDIGVGLTGDVHVRARTGFAPQRTSNDIFAASGTASKANRTVRPLCEPYAGCATAIDNILPTSTVIKVALKLSRHWKDMANMLNPHSNFNSTQTRLWQI